MQGVNPYEAENARNENGHVTGGYYVSKGVDIRWQDGPRGKADGTLAEPNGAFVEDAEKPIPLVGAELCRFRRPLIGHDQSVALSHVDDAVGVRGNELRIRQLVGARAVDAGTVIVVEEAVIVETTPLAP